jgi:hypothetical protein
VVQPLVKQKLIGVIFNNMPAGNNASYVTSLGCSTNGLSIGCPVDGADGWYSDGTNSYYVTNGSVTAVDTDPCYIPPAPPPPPPAVTWTAITMYRRSTISAAAACNFAYGSVGGATFYINASILSAATLMAALSDGTGTPQTGYYSDGGDSVYVSSQSISQFSQCTA